MAGHFSNANVTGNDVKQRIIESFTFVLRRIGALGIGDDELTRGAEN